MFKLLFSPLRLIRFGIRLAGLRNFTLIAIGVGIGLLVAPKPGAQFRQELSDRLEQRRAAGGGGGAPSPAPSAVPAASPSPATEPASTTATTTLSGDASPVTSVPPGSTVTTSPVVS